MRRRNRTDLGDEEGYGSQIANRGLVYRGGNEAPSLKLDVDGTRRLHELSRL